MARAWIIRTKSVDPSYEEAAGTAVHQNEEALKKDATEDIRGYLRGDLEQFELSEEEQEPIKEILAALDQGMFWEAYELYKDYVSDTGTQDYIEIEETTVKEPKRESSRAGSNWAIHVNTHKYVDRSDPAKVREVVVAAPTGEEAVNLLYSWRDAAGELGPVIGTGAYRYVGMIQADPEPTTKKPTKIKGLTEAFPRPIWPKFFDAYLEAALWSSTDADGHPLDDNYGPEDIAQSSVNAQIREVNDFIIANKRDLELARGHAMDDALLGHDFWLTRNHHGAGYWDRGMGVLGDRLTEAAHGYGSVDPYVGDGKIHLS